MRKTPSPLLAPLFLCASLLIPPTAQANDEALTVIVGAHRVPTEQSRVATSVTVIDAETIERRQSLSVAELLKGVPGVDVVQSGGRGGNAAVFIRGANSEHTLVLIDGVDANNPLTPTRAFNFSALTAENIERIEILRGPQSTLYGSDALGGVINIITKRGLGKPNAHVSLEGGSYDSFVERAVVGGGTEAAAFSLGVTREDIGGISSAGSKYGNSEDDSYDATSVSLRLDSSPVEQLKLKGVARFNRSHSDLDNNGGAGQDDLNRRLLNEQLFTRGSAEYSILPEVWSVEAGFSYAHQDTQDRNPVDESHPSDSLRSDFRGITAKSDLVSIVQATNDVRWLFGAEIENERGSSETFGTSSFGAFEEILSGVSSDSHAFFSQLDGSFRERFGATAGLRSDNPDAYRSETTWRLAPWLLLPSTDTKLLGSVGTGFKAPSLYQRFSPYGSADLKPEESLGWDIGAEQTIVPELLSLGTTYFENRFDDLISFDSVTFLFENIAEAKSSGFESFVHWTPTAFFSTRLSHTYTDTQDEIAGGALLRRARNKANLELRYDHSAGLSLSSTVRYTGASWDNDFSSFPANRTQLGGYTLVDIMARYRVTDSLVVFGRVENLFDKDYEQVLGFGERGIAAYGGISINLS